VKQGGSGFKLMNEQRDCAVNGSLLDSWRQRVAFHVFFWWNFCAIFNISQPGFYARNILISKDRVAGRLEILT